MNFTKQGLSAVGGEQRPTNNNNNNNNIGANSVPAQPTSSHPNLANGAASLQGISSSNNPAST
jgi:hypothetical protein